MNPGDLRKFLTGTLRGRLILSVAAVHAVMMTLFIFDSTVRQRAMLLENQTEEAVSLSRSLSTSAAGWIAAADISGLQEIAENERGYPELLFAIFADKEGRVLAHTDKSKLGLYLLDLPGVARHRVLNRSAALVDVAAPAMLGARHVGWVRIGIGQKKGAQKLTAMTLIGVLYAFAAIIVGSIIAWSMGRRITRRLYAVQDTIIRVRAGEGAARSGIAGGDEAASIAREFNDMLDRLDERDHALLRSESKYRLLLRNIHTAVIVHGPDTRILMSNPMAQELLGLTEEQMTGKSAIDPDWHFFREDGTVLPLEEYPVNRVLNAGRPLRDAVLGVHRAGLEEDVWVLVSANPLLDERGKITEVIVSFIDVTERKRNEAINVSRLHLVQYSYMHPLDELLEETLNETEKLTGSLIGFYHFVEDDQKTLTLQNWSTRTKAAFCKAEGKGLHYAITEAGVWVDCVHQRKAVIHNDYASLPNRKGMPEGHAAVIRELAVPVFRGNRISAILGIGNKPGNYTEKDIETVSLIADLAWEIAERKRAEETMRESREALSKREVALNESQRLAHIGSWDWDADKDTIWWSAEYYRIYGMDPETPTPNYADHLKAYTPESAERLDVAVKRAMETGEPYELDLEIDHPTESTQWIVARGEAKRDETGRIRGLCGTAQDLTERKQAEEALQNTAQRLNEAQRLAHVGNWELDLTSGILSWSDEIFRLFEIDPEKFGATYEAFLATIHPDDREAVNNAYTDSLKTRTPYTIDHRLLFPDGRVKFVHEQCETHYDGDKPVRSIGTVQDITERKQAEEALHRLNRELRAISNCNQILMRATDEKTLLNDICRIVCDEAGYRMAWVGYAENDAAQAVRPIAWAGVEDGYIEEARITWADTERGRGPTGMAIRSGETAFIQDFIANRQAAPWRELALQRGYRSSIALPLKDESDAVFGIFNIYSAELNAFTPEEIRLLEELAGDLAFGIVVLRARIKRALVEESLSKLTGELEQRVKKRTSDLKKKSDELKESQMALVNIVEDLNEKTNELEKVNTKLQELDHLKSMFIASMSHELRTPLSSIIGFSSILLNEWVGPVTGEQKDNLNAILRSGKHLLSLINDVIDVSKIEAGMVESINEEFDVYDIVSETVTDFKKDIDNKGLELEVRAVHQIIYSDRRRLLQCLLNLVSNAVKFTERGAIKIGVDISSEGEAIIISVSDTGIGIKRDDMEKLFTPFVRLDSPLKSKVLGTGLGLYLTKKLTREILRGDITVASSYGEGSRFEIKVPVSSGRTL